VEKYVEPVYEPIKRKKLNRKEKGSSVDETNYGYIATSVVFWLKFEIHC
jgi:hypothetical protein